ncbi:Pyridoxal 5'-phosphate synthase subunit snz1 [Coemansia biformis]|uniref:pyridoxal 5'-phosphate synthase (glutamine hydrolyzing) n=1 Tax=Coemansia biformis TaxID=1286918 RepID=A0A9W8CVF3_9FUNG|nr:Pyridoxal 5'-phosphate synthase subunit snz1 [Coemansia biformis]
MPEPPKETVEQRNKRHFLRVRMARLLTGGVIAVVHTIEQAMIAERFGARGVVVIGRTATQAVGPTNGMIARAPDPQAVKSILENILLPTVARVSVGHTMEGIVMQSSYADGIDESETLASASSRHIAYHRMNIPAISGVENLDEALKAITDGAAALRTKCPTAMPMMVLGHSREDTPDIRLVTSVIETIGNSIKDMAAKTAEERVAHAKDKGYGVGLLNQTIQLGRLPVPFFADGGIIFPLDAAMAMDLGYDGVIASVQLFQAANPEKRMRSLVLATMHYDKPEFLAKITEDHGTVGAIA